MRKCGQYKPASPRFGPGAANRQERPGSNGSADAFDIPAMNRLLRIRSVGGPWMTRQGIALGLAVVMGLAGCAGDPAATKEKHVAAGLRYLESGRYGDAIVALRNGLRIDPDDARGRYHLGRAYLRRGGVFEARQEFQAAAQARPELVGARVQLGKTALELDLAGEAERVSRELLAADPRSADAQVILARALTAQNRHDDAAAALDAALSNHPDHADARAARGLAAHEIAGMAHLGLGEHAKAEAAFQRALALDPAYTRARLGIGQVEPGAGGSRRRPGDAQARTLLAAAHLARGRAGQARAEFERLLEADPAHVPARLKLASLALREGRQEPAVEHYRVILRTDPGHLAAGLGTVNILAAQGQPEAAAAQIRAMLAVLPEMGGLRLPLADMLTRAGRYEEAGQALRETLEADPTLLEARMLLAALHRERRALDQASLGALLGLGEAHQRRGAVDEAVAAYRAAMRAAPDDPRAYNDLALILADRERDLGEAMRLARRATELAPAQGEVLDTLGWAYFRKGMVDDALGALKQAAGLLPRHPTVRDHLAGAHPRAGQRTEAAAALRQAVAAGGAFPEATGARAMLTARGG